jgi:DNA helicase-2/ATP-dependent DNA helicase PcrA
MFNVLKRSENAMDPYFVLVMYPHYNAGEALSYEHLVTVFTKTLAKGRLPVYEMEKQHTRGLEVLKTLYKHKDTMFTSTDKVEVDMKHEGVLVGEAHLVGKIDLLRITRDGYEVIDFKTGKGYASWDDAKTDLDKIKLHKYRQQLIVYKILLENSTTYKNLPVTKLSLWFVEDAKPTLFTLDLGEQEVERTKKLIEAVYHKIVTLDITFDTSKYGDTYKGLLQFEDDLIQGVI